MSDWLELHRDRWPAYAFDEPLFNSLLQHWRTPELHKLESLLLAACDRHTQQARFETGSTFWDMEITELWYDPFDILTIFQLRLSCGLDVPTINHLLMNTPLANLPEPTNHYSDDFLTKLIVQATTDYSDL